MTGVAFVMGARGWDPRDLAPIDTYLTDGDVLLQIVEVNWSGAVGENVCDGQMISIARDELRERWRRVTPAKA